MKTKLNKWKKTKLTINYLGNFNNKFGLAQKQTTIIHDANLLSLGISAEKTIEFPLKTQENIIKSKREYFNFHPIFIEDWESSNNFYFMNYIKNYPNLQRVNTSKRLSSYKRPKSSRHIYLRNNKESIKNNLNENTGGSTTSINTNINNFKNNKLNNVKKFATLDSLSNTSDKNSLKYFISFKNSRSKRRKFSKKLGSYHSEYDNFRKYFNFKEAKQPKYDKFLMAEFCNYKQKERNNDFNIYEGKKNTNFIFNNKLLRSKLNYFFSAKNNEFRNAKELVNENDDIVDNRRNVELNDLNTNKNLSNKNLSITRQITSNLCEASTNT